VIGAIFAIAHLQDILASGGDMLGLISVNSSILICRFQGPNLRSR